MLNECPTSRSIDSLTPFCVSRLLAMIIHSRYCLATRISVVYGIHLAPTCSLWYFVSAGPGYAGWSVNGLRRTAQSAFGTIEMQARRGAASQGVVGGCEKLKVAITLTFLLPSTSMWLLLHVSRFYLWRM